jgi:transposase
LTNTDENGKDIRETIKTVKNKNIYRRLEVIALRSEGKSNAEIAEITKYHPKRVSQLVSQYCNEGIKTLLSDGRKGGNHRYMSQTEETELLDKFKNVSEAGQVMTVSDIRVAYDKKTGKPSAKSTVYFLLKRHGWSKVMPRSRHPKKASDEAIEASKKLTLGSEK